MFFYIVKRQLRWFSNQSYGDFRDIFSLAVKNVIKVYDQTSNSN